MNSFAEVQNDKTFRQQLEFLLPRMFLLVLVLVSIFGARSTELRTFSVVFISILFEALPFMLLGSLAGGFIEEYMPRQKLVSLMPEGSTKAVFAAAAIGFVFPVCECAIIPVVRRLLRKGVPFSAAIAYLLAGPIVNPLVAISTAVAYFYNWKIVILRVGLGYAAAVLVGLLVSRLVKQDERLASQEQLIHDELAENSQTEHESTHNAFARFHRAIRHGANDFLEVACFLIAGAFFAGAAQTFIHRQAIISVMSETWLSILIMMVMAIALNLCSEADAFVASSFRNLVSVPGQLGFLVLGPMFDIKLFFMYFSIFSRKTAITLAVTTITTVYLLVWLSSFITPEIGL
ncbi:MAG: uncharacterized protein PWR01_2702 [Clostridiales bacterium]|jgi:uncharacterized membrane protein YraQ (UPF0718 family)|nr:uncharacterized protein [Clostridiales bacterium]MDN5281629.1 uncharacterized protein [Candidatus Ozemobacter sp.]